jgi:hypothetical protein
MGQNNQGLFPRVGTLVATTEKKVPVEDIVPIDGIDFVFDQGDISMRLDGKVLDHVHGHFIVLDRAI